MTDPDHPRDPSMPPRSPASEAPPAAAALGYYSPPTDGAASTDRPYEYVPAATAGTAPDGSPAVGTGYAAPVYTRSDAGGPAPFGADRIELPGDRPKGLAITALLIAVLGVLLAFIPAVVGFSFLVLLAAFIVSIVALASSKRGGKGFAASGLVLSILGGIIAVVVALLQAFGAFTSSQGYSSSYPYDDTPDYGLAAPGTDGIPDEGYALAEPVPLTVVETAFGREDAADQGWWYVVVLDNANADYVFSDATITVRALDATGAEIALAPQYVTALQGRSAVVLHSIQTDGRDIASLEVVVPDAAAALASPAGETGTLAAADVQRQSDAGSTMVTGTVAARFASDQEYPRVAVIARDAAGTILDADYAYLDTLPGDGTPVPFVAWLSPIPDDATLETFPAL